MIITRDIPVQALKRFPGYFNYLQSSFNEKIVYISVQAIADDLGFSQVQVKKDLALTGVSPKPKAGYSVIHLIRAIEKIMGWKNNQTKAVIAGMGSLGRALYTYHGFAMNGLEIISGFDTDNAKLGRDDRGRLTLPMDKLEEIVRESGAEIGIITVPAPAAQETADLFVKAGIAAIWNFAPAVITVPQGIAVQQENLAASAAILTQKLKTA